MSVDEFDPEIERLFARTPVLPDASLFAAEVQGRLVNQSRVRGVALTVAGLVGGFVAVRESLKMDFGPTRLVDLFATQAIDERLRTVTLRAQGDVQTGLDQLGLSLPDAGLMGGVQFFWLVAGTVAILAAAGAMRLSQDI